MVEFWLAATNFNQLIQNSPGNNEADYEQILNDAISIYEKYDYLKFSCKLSDYNFWFFSINCLHVTIFYITEVNFQI